MTSHRKIFLLTLLVWVTVALSLPHRTYAQKASAKVSAHQRQANARFVALWSDPSGDTYEHKEMTSLQAQKALNSGADVNARDRDGKTALITAAEIGMADTVRLLLTHGADVNSRDANGTTALMYAAIEDHVGVIQLLLAHGANVNARDRDGETALGMATRLSKAKAVAVLQAAGAK